MLRRYSPGLYTVILFSLAGVIISAYLTYLHYEPSGGSVCNISDYVNCDVVNKSIYAELLGIPVAILGFLAYVGILVSSIGLLKNWRFEKILDVLTLRNVLVITTTFAGMGFLFSLYLTYIEFFVLQTLCILCFTQQILIFIIFAILFSIWLRFRKLSLV